MLMSFTTKSAEKFNTVFDKSEYHCLDPIVRVQYVQRGNNIVFGRTISNENYSNLLYLGKVLENTVGKNYLSSDAWLDTTFPHVIYITGTRGSGKSFDLGVILEGISKLQEPSAIQNAVEPITSILIDTQSQFWTLRYKPNQKIKENQSQLEELAKWNISPNALANCRLFIPPNSDRITGDEVVFHLRTDQIKQEEWCALIREDTYSPQGHILAETIEALQGSPYSIEDMIGYISTPSNWPSIAESSRNAVAYKLDDYRRTGLFAKTGLEIRDLLVPGRCNVFLLRDLRNEDKALITGLIARQLFTVMGAYHKKLKVDRFFDKDDGGENLPSKVWLLIDEAHVVAPSSAPSPAREALIEYVKRGRDAGLSLVMATQQPSAIDDRILSQVNVTLSHRLSFQSDIQAAVNRIPTKLLASLKLSGIEVKEFGEMLRFMESGQCFLGDHNTSRTVLIKVRPRVTSHGGYSPV
jgi:uncharacterized protein